MGADLALDFGTAATRLATPGGELVLEEPTIAAVEADSGRLLAFGADAEGLGATSGGRVQLARPVRAGKILDLDLAESYLAAALRVAGISRLSNPRMLVCAHLGATGVQRRAIARALRRAGVRAVSFLEQPLACAIGAGLEISEPLGSMVLDVGAGTCDVAVIALGGLVSTASVEIGGDHLDDALRDHLARRHGLVVEPAYATSVRERHASLRPRATGSVEVVGRASRTGEIARLELPLAELGGLIDRVAQPIFDAAARCIAESPPDLANDLLKSGLVLAGGCSQIAGFPERLARVTGVPVHLPSEPERLGILGAALCLAEGMERVPVLSAPRPH